MAVNESARAAGIDLAHVVRDIVGDEVRVELQRQLGGLSDRERRIMDMWPRFEDGEPVWIGDAVELDDWSDEVLYQVHIGETGFSLYTETHDEWHDSGDMVKRPAPKALDADGVEIKVGDTVWHHSGLAHGVVTSIDAGSLMGTVRYVNGGVEFRDAAKDLTHTRPDSWERLEEDAESIRQIIACNFGDFSPSDFKQSGDSLQDRVSGLVRRAKALAGVEVAG